MKKIFLSLCVATCMLLNGCGGDGKNVSGTLTMADVTTKDLTYGKYQVATTATYTPDSGKEATGAEITFTALYTTPSNSTPVKKTSKYTLSKTGIANFSNEVIQGSEPIYLNLIATIGDLSSPRSYTTIPLYDVSLRAAPTTVNFIQIDPVGGQASVPVTLSGGYLSYDLVSNDRPTDIEAIFTGATTLTISKLSASGTTSAPTYALIILQDSKGSTATVRVNYFK